MDVAAELNSFRCQLFVNATLHALCTTSTLASVPFSSSAEAALVKVVARMKREEYDCNLCYGLLVQVCEETQERHLKLTLT